MEVSKIQAVNHRYLVHDEELYVFESAAQDFPRVLWQRPVGGVALVFYWQLKKPMNSHSADVEGG